MMTNKAESEGQNRRAYLALRGGSADWRGDLSALLRSSEPISQEVRDILADMIEGSSIDGIRLTMQGHKQARDFWVGLEARREWYAIGKWIAAAIANGQSRKLAVEQAAQGEGGMAYGEDKCDAALEYARRLDGWLNALPENPPLPRDDLIEIFHYNDFRGRELSAGRLTGEDLSD